MKTGTLRISLSIAAIVSIGACGGGGGGGGGVAPPPPPPPATPTDAVVVGAITGFGSIFVNGVEFDTSGAAFTLDDDPGVESDLAIGQVVTVAGTLDEGGARGTAEQVTFENQVEGAVTSIDLAASRIVVLGQVIVIEGSTIFDDRFADPSLAGLAVGDLVEVSGFPDASGAIVASRIEPMGAGGDLEVRGTVASLDAAAGTFALNGLVVDYSGASLEDFPSGAPADGEFVEVHGDDVGPDGELVATRVEREDGPFDGVGGDVKLEVEGLITRFSSASDFDVAGQPVTTTAGTAFENGDGGDLAAGVKVEAEGFVGDDGVLAAVKLSIRRENDARIEAPVEAVDAAAGTLTVYGVPVTVDALTRLEDASDADVRDFDLGDVVVGDYVEVRGVESPADGDALLASELRREDPEGEVTVQGAVDAETPDTALVILGLTIQVDGQTQYRDAADAPMSASEFFDAVDVATSVKARGDDLGGGTLAADEVELEPER